MWDIHYNLDTAATHYNVRGEEEVTRRCYDVVSIQHGVEDQSDVGCTL